MLQGTAQEENHRAKGVAPTPWTLVPGTMDPSKSPATKGALGVLALQGDFLEHLQLLRHLGLEGREVRLAEHLRDLDGLIIPGGESTTMAHLLDNYGLRDPLRQRIQAGMPVWGTCAGMILLARRLREDRPQPLGVLDIEVARNAYGRQVESFEADLAVERLGVTPFKAIFIRAPVIQEVGPRVEVLARLPDGSPVAVREGTLLATAFHPELTRDTRFHQYFLELVGGKVSKRR